MRVNKYILLSVFLGLFVILLSSSALATVRVITPVSGTNYSTGNLTSSTYIVFNVTYVNATDGDGNMTGAVNATFYYNLSGTWTTIGNGSLCGVVNSTTGACWASLNLSNLSTSSSYVDGFYSIKALLWNQSGIHNVSATVFADKIGFDSLSPAVSAPSLPVNSGNYSGTKVLRVLVTDATVGVQSVAFNVTNSSNAQNVTYTAARDGATDYWTYSLNTAYFLDGHYNITVLVNDSLGHINRTTAVYNITIDNTAPTAPVLSSSSVTQGSITATVTSTDALSGLLYTSCSISRLGASLSGQTLTETDLSCGSTYSYIVTCSDLADNSAASTTYSYTTSSCGSGGTGGSGGGGSTIIGTTYVPAVQDLETGYQKQLASNERVKVSIGTETHYVAVKSLTTTQATIEISSDPVQVVLGIGEESKVDVNADNVYDVYVKLNSITNNKADVTVKTISEAIPAGEAENGVTTTAQQAEKEQEKQDTAKTQKLLMWVGIIVGVLIILAIIFTLSNSKKKRRYFLYGY